jgi:hypothetical protein
MGLLIFFWSKGGITVYIRKKEVEVGWENRRKERVRNEERGRKMVQE